MMGSQCITKVIETYPPSNVNLCTNFHDNPANSCRGISLKAKRQPAGEAAENITVLSSL